MEDLQKLITGIVRDLEDDNQMNERLTQFVDYKNKYVVLKPSVKVSVELTNGRTFTIDVTDYFEGVVK